MSISPYTVATAEQAKSASRAFDGATEGLEASIVESPRFPFLSSPSSALSNSIIFLLFSLCLSRLAFVRVIRFFYFPLRSLQKLRPINIHYV